MKHNRLAAVALSAAFIVASPSLAQTAVGQTYNAFVGGFIVSVDGDRDPAQGPFSKGGTPGPNFAAQSAVGGNWSVGAKSDDVGGGRVQVQADLSIWKPGVQTYARELLAQAELQYVFKIDGTDQDPVIPVQLIGYGGASGSKSGGFEEALLAFDHDGTVDRYYLDLHSGDPGAGFSVNEIYNLQPGHLYYLTMAASAHVFAEFADPDTGIAAAGASVDPTFTILGGYGSRYHFVGLPSSAIGTESSSGVPEPATWALLVCGFGMVGNAMRRRQRQISAT